MVVALPARFLNTRNQAVASHAPETDPADAKLAINGTAAPAYLATKPDADFVARPQLRFLGGSPTLLKLGELLSESGVLC
jgi:hypothetical protein